MSHTSPDEGPKAFLVHAVAPGAEPGVFVLDGRCCEGTMRPNDRFVGLYLVDVDEGAGESKSELLAEVDLLVLQLFAYGKVRKRLDQGMTGRITVRRDGGEEPMPDVLLRTAGPAV
jgi:hypothetical protein